MGRLRAAPFVSLEALRFQHLKVQAQEVEAEDFFDVGGRMPSRPWPMKFLALPSGLSNRSAFGPPILPF
jgi:hypothetical protein